MEYYDYEYSNYSSSDPWEDEDYNVIPSPPWSRIIPMSLASATALLANVFLLVVLCSAPPRLSTSSNVIFLQRAIADLLSSIAIVFFTIGISGAIIIMPGTCITFDVLFHVGEMASVVFLMAFTVDSYLAAYPQHHPPPSRRKTMILSSTLAWILAAAAGISSNFLARLMGWVCNSEAVSSRWRTEIKIIEMAALFLVPLIVTWVLVSVALRPRPYSSPAEATELGERGPNRKLMLSLTSVFTINFSLFWIFELMMFFEYYAIWVSALAYIIMTLPIFNSAISSILVICLTEDLRQRVAGWLQCRRHSTSLPLEEL